METYRRWIVEGAVIAVLIVGAWAIAPGPAAKPVNATGGPAIHGIDPVAYFTEGKPVQGVPAYSHRWREAEWRFVSAANRDAFAADPAKYAPQYGGFCAYGLAQGYRVDIDPRAWKIVGGKLYLNYSLDVQSQWNQDIPGYVARADANWAKP